jgi:succinyl-CoA synthetase alpha subunit
MGGDVLAGTNFVDALKIFEHDDDTEGILLIGEVGGKAEMDAVEWIKDYNKRTKQPKPIAALIGGVRYAPGRIMGHAGAFLVPGDPDARAKITALQSVGVKMVNHPAKFGEAMKSLLSQPGRDSSGKAMNLGGQRRGLHTMARRAQLPTQRTSLANGQRRTLYLQEDQAFDLLRKQGINASEYSGHGKRRLLAIAVDRSTTSPCVIAAPGGNEQDLHAGAKSFPFDYRNGLDESVIPEISKHLQLEGESSVKALSKLVKDLVGMFMKNEAFLLETNVVERLGELKVVGARFGFDDAAYRSSGRNEAIHAMRRGADEVPEELEAEKHGIVYIKLAGDGNIGTLVNGAGLAMNTVDALADAGGKAANFLDTGGKATSETVKKSFEVILKDKRVKAIFVNIFGGLTLGDMIANGVLLAFKELDMSIPVVVRIRGTNEKEGQKIVSAIGFGLGALLTKEQVAESGLQLHAFDDFEAAAAKVIELANRA